MRNKRQPKWEKEYLEYAMGIKNEIIEQLKEKMDAKTINKDEFKEYQKMEKVKGNVSKVANVIELRDNIQEKQDKLREEIEKRDTQNKATEKNTAEQAKLDKELEKLKEEEIAIRSQLKNKDLKPEDRAKLQDKQKENLSKLNENSIKFAKLAVKSEPKVDKEFADMSLADLKAYSFVLGTKLSKCYMAGKQLMEGRDFDNIFENVKTLNSKKYTEKQQGKESNAKSAQQPIGEHKKEDVELTPEEIEENEAKEKLVDLMSKKETLETALVTTDVGFFGRLKNVFKSENKMEALKNVFISPNRRINSLDKKMNKIIEEYPSIVAQAESIIATKKEELRTEKFSEESMNKENEEFDVYLKNVAEKGIKGVKQEKMQAAREKLEANRVKATVEREEKDNSFRNRYKVSDEQVENILEEKDNSDDEKEQDLEENER